ncbi:MAG: vitamin K epoxide reductase family protein [Actinomycetota bacterium]|nr:vitamin K epoxide reductase family protein [Actinomycetota bacterium]
MSRATPWILTVGGGIGLFASVELITEKFALLADPDASLFCDINPVVSCGSVLLTEEASAFGFANPILGLIGFAVVVTLGVLALAKVELPRWVWIGLNIGALFGFSFMMWLMWQSLYVIGALCPWCMIVWAVTILIFWNVTVDNLASGRINLGAGVAEIAGALRWFLVAGTYLIIAGLIFVRWLDFWLGRG